MKTSVVSLSRPWTLICNITSVWCTHVEMLYLSVAPSRVRVCDPGLVVWSSIHFGVFDGLPDLYMLKHIEGQWWPYAWACISRAVPPHCREVVELKSTKPWSKGKIFYTWPNQKVFLDFQFNFYRNGNYCSLHCTALMQKDGTGCQFWHWEDECWSAICDRTSEGIGCSRQGSSIVTEMYSCCMPGCSICAFSVVSSDDEVMCLCMPHV